MPSERIQRRIDDLLDQAEQAVTDRNWAAVQEVSQSVLAVDGENSDALAFLAMSEPHLDGAMAQVPTSPAVSTSNDAPPTSFADGRYTVSQFLGEGGKKKVYLAHDTTLDRDVAFAIIKTDGLDDVGRERVRREAQAMGRMGTHPHIMPIYDLGEESGQPFMVQPVMAGGDVEALIEDAEGPLELETAIRIAGETCRGLQFAHEKGIVHRDLKPGNVWMDENGLAKIGDFGLAVATDRSRLTVEKMMVGTVNYMPPEQATGGDVTARADLYSLGAMLYEMVTGRPPFLGDDDIAIIGQHINTPPVSPRWHNPAISAQLDSLIMRLMSKNPAERPESAADVLTALDGIQLIASGDGAAPATDGEGLGETDQTGSLDSMAGGVFVGRHAEMDQLKAKLESALSGRGGMVTLVGEPGIGKTRTSLELETYAGLRNAQVLWGRCYEGGGAPPYWPWVQAIRSYVSSRQPDELRRDMGSTASVIAEIVDDVRQSLPDIAQPNRIDDPESARFRLFDSIATFLKNAGQTRPLVLILDDLHWADKPSLLLLEFVVRELASSRLLVVGTYRDMELNRRHPLSVTLGDLTRERLFERILLRGLTRSDIGRFIEVASGVNPPLALVDAVHTQTEGNPLFVTETVRLLIQEGELTPEKTANRDSWTVRIPEGVREVIGRRLDRLSERCNEVLTTAAVIGRQFNLAVIQRLAGDISDDRMLDVLDEAIDARIIEEVSSEVGLYQFTHALMQETLTSELSLTRRVRLHARIAETLEANYGTDADRHAVELAEQFGQARTVLGTERFVHYSRIAGETALANFAFEAAYQYLDRAMQELGEEIESDEHAAIAGGRVRAQLATVAPRELAVLFPSIRKVFDYWRSRGELDKAIDISLLDFRYGPFRYPEIEPILADALELPEPGTIQHGRVLSRHGFVLYWEVGDNERGLAELDQALDIAEKLGDRSLQMAVRLNFARIGEIDTNTEQGFHNGMLARELAIETGDDLISATAATTVGMSALFTGRMEEAKHYSDESRERNRRVKSAILNQDDAVLACRIAYSQAQFDKVEKWADVASAHAPDGRRQIMISIMTAWHLGDLDRGRGLISRFMELIEVLLPDDPGWISLPVRAAMHARTFDIGIPEFDQIMELGEKGLDSRRPKWVEEIMLSVIAWALSTDQRERALELRAKLPEPNAQFSSQTLENYQRLYGEIATGLQDFEAAEKHFEQALEQCGSEYVVERAHTCYQYTQMLLARGDQENASRIQDDAISLARDHGLKTILERVLAQREILKA